MFVSTVLLSAMERMTVGTTQMKPTALSTCLCAHLNMTASGLTLPQMPTGKCKVENNFNVSNDCFRIEGPTPTSDTGPQFDHTIGLPSGHYLYFEGDTGYGASAHYTSPDLRSEDGSCTLRFYYYMHGKDIGSLLIKTVGIVNGNVTSETVRIKISSQ